MTAESPQRFDADADADADAEIGAIDVLRRGVRITPSIKRPLAFSAGLSLLTAAGRLAIPILVQQVIDRGLLGPDGYQPRLVLTLAVITLAIVVAVAVLAPIAEIAMVRGAQESLHELRRAAFARIHALSLAEHNREQRGTLLARVTSDVESLSRFVEWGAMVWSTNVAILGGAFVVMLVYSWQLALVTAATMSLVVPVARFLQRRQLRAYDRVRTAVGDLLSVFNEVLTGGDAIRSYGYEDAAQRRMDDAVDGRYRAQMGAAKYMATLFTVGDLLGAITVVVVAVVAVGWGDGWGLGVGTVVSFFFLIALIQSPIGELTEVLDQTQTAVAGWNKVLTLLEREPDMVEPDEPLALPSGALEVEARGLDAGYDGTLVLRDVDLVLPAGARVAVVGETGSGKTTFVRLLCRLLDPVAGEIRLGGVDLRRVGADERRRRLRMVPQDGFLFDTTVAENIRFGRPGAARADVVAAITTLGLEAWVASLPDGLDSPVGPRGELLSVGERQLVALARAQVADPGLLILDEATSSVDPETEMALTLALDRVAEGRTVVSVAHRLSTAEHADLVVVFDAGSVVEVGSHRDLLAGGGRYAELHAGWRRATSAG
ncbi:MAG: ABC transporter ATP-binding protein [Acidimicrobiales bacterium]